MFRLMFAVKNSQDFYMWGKFSKFAIRLFREIFYGTGHETQRQH